MRAKQTFLIVILTFLLTIAIFPVQATFTLKQNVILKTSANNTQFIMGFDAELYKLRVNSTHLFLDKQYTAKHYTEYCLWVESPSDTQFVIDSWFQTANSTAQLRIVSPLAMDVHLHFSSPNLLSAYAQNVVNYTWISANQTLCMFVNTATSSSFTIYATVSETEYNHSPENVDVEITDMEGCGNWVFSQTKFYTFVAKFWDGDGYADLSECSVAFMDGLNWVNATYDLVIGVFRLDDGSDLARLGSGTVTIIDANEIQVTFPIYFQNTILDMDNVSIYMRCIDLYGASDGWELIKANYFNIYNLGGHSTLVTVGDAGRITGGDIFDLYCGNMSSVEATIMFRDLQHVKMMPTVQAYAGELGYSSNITFFMEYCVGDVWVRPFSIVLTPSAAYYSGVMWWNWTATYYELGAEVKTEKFWSYYQNVNETQYTADTQLWVDLWFNRMDASKVWGARVNSYYYPMTDSANMWLRWLAGSKWGVDERLSKQSECFGKLRDSDGNVMSVSNVKLVRVGCNITARTLVTKLQHFTVFDLTIGSDPLQGIQTPPWDETKVPTMNQGGLLGAIWSALQNGFNSMWKDYFPYLVTAWMVFVELVDSVFAWAGYPGAFRTFTGWLGSMWGLLLASITYSVSLMTAFFSFVSIFMVQLIAFISEVFQWWGMIFTVTGSFLAGGYGTGVNIWTTYNVPQWITLGLILYPIYLMFLWEEEGLGAVIDQITFIYNTLHLMVYVFLTMVHYISAMISRLIEAIPVVE
jgi:hypothetical protein